MTAGSAPLWARTAPDQHHPWHYARRSRFRIPRRPFRVSLVGGCEAMGQRMRQMLQSSPDLGLTGVRDAPSSQPPALGWTARGGGGAYVWGRTPPPSPPFRTPQPTPTANEDEQPTWCASGTRKMFLAPVNRGTEPPPPPFVVRGNRRPPPPDLCIFKTLRMEQEIQKFPQTRKQHPPPPLLWTPCPRRGGWALGHWTGPDSGRWSGTPQSMTNDLTNTGRMGGGPRLQFLGR